MPQRVNQKDRRGVREQVLHVEEDGEKDAAQKVPLLLHAVDGPEKQACVWIVVQQVRVVQNCLPRLAVQVMRDVEAANSHLA